MKIHRIKRYRIAISRTFPVTHLRKGETTGFVDQLHYSINFGENAKKIHTIRKNYELWEKRMAEVQAGRAVIELFYWEEKPYRSTQVVFATLNKDSGCGIQELIFLNNEFDRPCIFGKGYAARSRVEGLAEHDGLSMEDFKEWFKGYDLKEPMAIIHFTKFRY